MMPLDDAPTEMIDAVEAEGMVQAAESEAPPISMVEPVPASSRTAPSEPWTRTSMTIFECIEFFQNATLLKLANLEHGLTNRRYNSRGTVRPILRFFHNLLCNSPLLQIYEVVFQLQSGDL